MSAYLAYSIARVSRMTLTLISPGYFISSSIFFAISLASFIDPKTQRPVPAFAYVAYGQAGLAATNIYNSIKNKIQVFTFIKILLKKI